jgi:DNA-directed RNA polymerase specialized sigma24 family protein
MLTNSQEWWAKEQWTRDHYKLASELMSTIHVLPRDWDDDVIQEIAQGYRKARNTGRGGNYRAWLRTLLYHKAIDMYRSELHIRMKEGKRPIFVSFESLTDAELPCERMKAA